MGELLAEFMEVESGLKIDRPQLAAALDQCRRSRAVLVIAKLDRLSRNVAFVARLKESGAEFVAVVQSWPFPLSSGCGLGHKGPIQAFNTGLLPS